MPPLWRKTNVNPSFLPVLKLSFFWSRFTNGWNYKTGDTITLDKNEIIYGVGDNVVRHLGLNLCLIIAKYYLYTASRKEEEFFDAFLAILTNKIETEKHISKSQMNVRTPPIVANPLHEITLR